MVRLSIHDDGAGFNPDDSLSAKDGHFGLLGMRERAQQINGKLTVVSNPGEGTEITIEAPIV
jgi:signal transduction histidine kinase